MAESTLLAREIAKVSTSFRDVERLHKKGPLTGLPEWLLTLEDVRAVVSYNSFRGRITLTAPLAIDVRVPRMLVHQIQSDIEERRLFGTKIRVRSLSFWDHLLLWRIRVRSLIPT
jgi:hypothetical protein